MIEQLPKQMVHLLPVSRRVFVHFAITFRSSRILKDGDIAFQLLSHQPTTVNARTPMIDAYLQDGLPDMLHLSNFVPKKGKQKQTIRHEGEY
jgi:hypothetical protein